MRYSPNHPLPEKRFLPGQNPSLNKRVFHGWQFPESPPFLPIDQWSENAFHLYGVDLFNHGYYWEAHEVWGEAFRAARGLDETQQLFYQSLIQIAAAFIHLLADNGKAARATSSRAVSKLCRLMDQHGAFLMGVDLNKLHDETISQIQDPGKQFPMITLENDGGF